MSGCMSMLGGMAVGRTVTAQGDATFLACAQMNPAVAGLHTFGTFQSFRVLNGINPGDIRTGFRRHNPQSSFSRVPAESPN